MKSCGLGWVLKSVTSVLIRDRKREDQETWRDESYVKMEAEIGVM